MSRTSGATSINTFITKTLLNGVTTTTTSSPANIGGAKKVMFEFTRADHVSGSSDFAIEISFDGTTWTEYNKLISNVTNTNAQNLTRVAAPTLSSNTTEIYAMSPEDAAPLVRAKVTEDTDGTHTCKIHIQY